MFVVGLFMLAAGSAMAVTALFAPSVALPGLIGGAAGLGIAGFVLTYLGRPERRRRPPPGMVRGSAWVLSAEATGGEATGYRMVELTLEVRPEGSAPFQVRRSFVGNRADFVAGEQLKVFYDPIDPKKVELAR